MFLDIARFMHGGDNFLCNLLVTLIVVYKIYTQQIVRLLQKWNLVGVRGNNNACRSTLTGIGRFFTAENRTGLTEIRIFF
jgi:hypothetical protein